MSLDDLKIKRREMIKIMGSGAAAVYLGGCVTSGGHIPMTSAYGYGLGPLNSVGPIDRTIGDVAPRVFSGDNPSLAHRILWNKPKFMESLTLGQLTPSESVKVAVVGGGMSGLLSAYMLRHHEPLLLEQAPRFGGNSRGESWAGLDYSLATAYFGVPEPGGAIDKLFKEIGVDGRYRIHQGDDSIFISGKKYDNIWQQGTVSGSKRQFQLLARHFADVLNNRNGKIFPHVPATNDSDRAYIDKLDRMSFHKYAEKLVGGRLHPHVEEVIENYFWSAAAASSTETSAACGLNFFASDFDKVAILPGGNGAIAEALLARLFLEVPRQKLRPSSLVFDVKAVADGVHVSYLDAHEKVHTVHASQVVMSCPKFIARHLINNLEPDRIEAISKIRYRSYLVANVLVNQHIEDNFYDSYFFKGESEKLSNVREAAENQKVTDVVYGNYAKPEADRTVLSVFRGFPYDGARPKLYEADAYDRYRREFEEQIYGSILPLMSVAKNNVVDLRIARWGHPLPVSDVGNIANNLVDILRRPFRDRIFFIEQDNWTLPAFETAFHEAHYFVPQIESLLNGVPMNKMTGAQN